MPLKVFDPMLIELKPNPAYVAWKELVLNRHRSDALVLAHSYNALIRKQWARHLELFGQPLLCAKQPSRYKLRRIEYRRQKKNRAKRRATRSARP